MPTPDANETVWVSPNAANLDSIMSQLVLNAGEKQQSEGGDSSASRSASLMAVHIQTIRATIAVAGKSPISQLSDGVPPEAELHIYVLTVNSLTAAVPNLGTVVVGMGGVFSPWNDLVKQARSWMDSVRSGKLAVSLPTDPVLTGDGSELVPAGATYGSNLQNTYSGLQVGLQYQWVPGPNEASFTCGSTTLTAAGSFYAGATSFAVTGSTAAAPVTGSLQLAQPKANYTTAGGIVGAVDMSTD